MAQAQSTTPVTAVAFQPLPQAINSTNITSQAPTDIQVPVLSSQMHQNLFNAFRQATASYTSPVKGTQQDSSSNGVSFQGQSHPNTGTPPSQSHSQSGGIHSSQDLTSGQAQQDWINETMAIIPTLDPTNYSGRFSPTYTSKSFDDLHQFIGNDVPDATTTDEGVIGPASMAANRLKLEYHGQRLFKPHVHAQRSHFSLHEGGEMIGFAGKDGAAVSIKAADEYAYYAQQSAMEASKHSAYFRPDASPLCQPQPLQAIEKHCDTPIVAKQANPNSHAHAHPNPASFNNANIQLHSHSNKDIPVTTIQGASVDRDPSSLGPAAAPTTTQFNAHTHAPATRHRRERERERAPVVSGSERSSSDTGNDRGSSSSGSGSSSDNDNSDSASDGGPSASDADASASASSTPSALQNKRKSIVNEENVHREKKMKVEGQDTQ